MRTSESLRLRSLESEVASARRFVRACLDGVQPALPGSAVDDLVLVTSELVTNAVEHGNGGFVDVTVGDDGARTVLSVTSRADHDGFELVGDGTGWDVAEPTSRAGRGLGIVRSLVDEVTVGRTGDRLTITVVTRR